MVHVLLMAAGELRHPVAFGVLVESGDRYEVTQTLELSQSTDSCSNVLR